MNINSFLRQISPSSSEIQQASTSWWYIRSTVTNNSEIISGSHLTGSYKRWTQITPINDIDIIFKVNFSSTHIVVHNEQIYIALNVWTYDNHKLKDFSIWDEYICKYIVSPIRIINHIWSLVSNSYTSTQNQWRNWECYSVYLSAYSLNIDCLPYTWVTDNEYRLIPSWWQKASWKKTNPRLDEEKLNTLNTEFNGKVKDIIKILKYWNKKKNTSKKFKSYTLECLIYWAIKNECHSWYSYQDILKVVIDKIYTNVDQYRNIRDISDYDYIYYALDWNQINTVKQKLYFAHQSISSSEEGFVEYLNN